MEIEFTDKNFDQEIAQGIVLVDFWAPWCGPCQIMGPVIEELAKDFAGKAKIGKCNVDENGDVAGKMSIMSIPALKIFKDGKIAKEFVGVQAKDVLKSAIEELL